MTYNSIQPFPVWQHLIPCLITSHQVSVLQRLQGRDRLDASALFTGARSRHGNQVSSLTVLDYLKKTARRRKAMGDQGYKLWQRLSLHLVRDALCPWSTQKTALETLCRLLRKAGF